MNRSTKITIGLCVVLVLFAAFRHGSASAATALPDPTVDESLSAQKGQATLVVAGGCFWGVQAVFQHVKGVASATSGYSGGTVKNPAYEEVSSGSTGHAESVQIIYDPSQITLGQLLKVFFSVAHDPTELNRQGPDSGTQYRSAIFFSTPDQQRIAQAYIQQLDQAKVFSHPIVTQIAPFKAFYRAEDYHQNYATNHPDNPYIATFDLPKVKHLQQQFPSLYR
ncbi:MAG TPA: peptide-methionine (S)-S-oxide reductase MsrA [Candidatus Acidoferrales bacterium]|nr:peptide-methionine (S)-S-oxide reductase MsrA [Candidatus Acidoferrales bacterium]